MNGKELGQFHPDFEIVDKHGEKMDHYKDIRSIQGIFVGKKCYLDVLEAINENTNEKEKHLHIRMKGVPTSTIKWQSKKLYPDMDENDAVIQIYKDLLAGQSIEFDLTEGGTRACFDSAKNFTVRSRDKFSRQVQFL